MARALLTFAAFAGLGLGALALAVNPPLAAAQSYSRGGSGGDAGGSDKKAEKKPTKRAEFKREWFYYGDNDARWKELQKQQGRTAPALKTGAWIGGKRELAKMKDQIVLIDFWATWCGPCKAAVPHTNELMEKYEADRVGVIAVCCTDGSEAMQKVATATGMKYPTGADSGSATANAYGVKWWPFYVLVDRKGVIRAAGLNPDHVGDAIDALLGEQPAEK